MWSKIILNINIVKCAPSLDWNKSDILGAKTSLSLLGLVTWASAILGVSTPTKRCFLSYFLIGLSRPLFLYFRHFNTVDNRFCINIPPMIGFEPRTANVRMSHNHCPCLENTYLKYCRWKLFGSFFQWKKIQNFQLNKF